MSKQIFAIDPVGYSSKIEGLGAFFDFYVNNVFYLLAPEYYYQFYAIYLNRCLSVYDGWVGGWHNSQAGLVPQRMLQSVVTGLNNMLFAHGIDFNGSKADYDFAVKWAKRTKFYKAIKKGHKFDCAGGTALLKLNRSDKELFATSHRIDNFFVDVDAAGKVVSAKVFFDIIHDTNPTGVKGHYGIAEERYFNEDGRPCVKSSVYAVTGNLQTEMASRRRKYSHEPEWEMLPRSVRNYIRSNYPDIIVGKEILLPFSNSIGCYIITFTDDIPQIPNLPFGQPIGDILFTENFQYDQMKWFEKNEVDLARARAHIPDDLWNKDDPHYDSTALSERFYQKVPSVNGDNNEIIPIQFLLRGEDIRKQKENIFKDIAFKLQVSASSIASFLNEGAGARTATEIISERTKSDTWIKGQINLISPPINELLKDVMYFYNKGPVEIILRAEDQSPFLDKLKVNSDVLNMGNMSPERFVRGTYSNLSQEEQSKEIEYIQTEKLKSEAQQIPIVPPNKKAEFPEDQNTPAAEKRGEKSA